MEGVGADLGDGLDMLLGGANFASRCERTRTTPITTALEDGSFIVGDDVNLGERGRLTGLQTDCSELVILIQFQDLWPAFSILMDKYGELRASFPSFSLSLISCSFNIKTD